MWHLVLASVLMASPAAAPHAPVVVEKGVVHFEPLGDQKNIPDAIAWLPMSSRMNLKRNAICL